MAEGEGSDSARCWYTQEVVKTKVYVSSASGSCSLFSIASDDAAATAGQNYIGGRHRRKQITSMHEREDGI